MSNKNKYAVDTICAKDIAISGSGHSHILPIHPTSAFSYARVEDSIDVFSGKKEGYVYSRYANPTVKAVEQKLAQLEGLELDELPGCLLTSSGLSAISTFLFSQCKAGDVIVTQDDLYGGTTEMIHKVLAQAGVDVIAIDLNDLDLLRETLAGNEKVKLVYFETPANPTLRCLNIKGITELCTNLGCLTAIDNTFASFYLQQPFTLGVDFVLYSTTKYLNGHGNSIAGAILSRQAKDRNQIWDTMKLMGTNCNPWDAWLLNNGLKTLTLRMDRHCSNANQIAHFLEDHAKVRKVNYPGLVSHATHQEAKAQMKQYGGMLSFEIDGSYEDGLAFMNNTQLCSITATLGNVDTLLLHPASSSHLKVDKAVREASGISDSLIRMSVGIENVKDLINDISETLAGI